jgi:hypothetical protein
MVDRQHCGSGPVASNHRRWPLGQTLPSKKSQETYAKSAKGIDRENKNHYHCESFAQDLGLT